MICIKCYQNCLSGKTLEGYGFFCFTHFKELETLLLEYIKPNSNEDYDFTDWKCCIWTRKAEWLDYALPNKFPEGDNQRKDILEIMKKIQEKTKLRCLELHGGKR